MSHPCPFKVYRRTRGVARKLMIARFAERPDAVNFAFEVSRGRFGSLAARDHVDVLVYNLDDRLFVKFHRGIKI